MTRATLPLGIDIGTVRTRVALLERDSGGTPRLVAVATRTTGDDPSGAIADAHAELATRERRCVLGLGAPDALLRVATFPRMGRRERENAARFDAARLVPYPLAEAEVRVVPLEGARYAVGVARRASVASRVTAAKRARLRPLAVDDTAFAWLRAVPHGGAIVDVGESATRMVIPGDPLPATRTFAIGGRALTAAVAESLGIDHAAAEARKHSVGLAGAGQLACDALVEHIATALIEARAGGNTALQSIALGGNAARLTGFGEALERAVAIPVRFAALPPDASRTLPADVVRAASPDWALAYGLALWNCTG
jgi:Tfp pilus assembly PilM family ATPase